MEEGQGEAVPYVVLVTGASRGIGKTIAEALAAKGATVALHYNSSVEKANAIKASLPAPVAGGKEHACFKADISSPAECQRLMQEVVAFYGRLDVLVNNAAVSIDKQVNDYTYEEWQKAWNDTLDLNYHGAASLMYLAIHQFLKQEPRQSPTTAKDVNWPNRGRIVNISSRAAYAGDVTAPAYAVSKSALNTLTQAFGKELASDAIYCYTVSPGATDTDMWNLILTKEERKAFDANHPLGRIGQPEEVATAVVFYAYEAPPVATSSILDLNGAMYTH